MSDAPQVPEGLEPSPEELEAAAQELEALTPGEWLSQKAAYRRAKNQLAELIHEFPVVALVDLSTTHGDRVALTFRGLSGPDVLDEAAATMAYARKYNLMPAGKRHAAAQTAGPVPTLPVVSPVAPIPAPAPVVPQYVPVSTPADPGTAFPADARGNTPGKIFTEKLARIEVKIEVGGVVKVGLYPYLGNGTVGKFQTTWEQNKNAATWAQLFAGRIFLQNGQLTYLTEAHFSQPAIYEVPVGTIEVEYIVAERRAKQGAGNYYINVSRVLPPE